MPGHNSQAALRITLAPADLFDRRGLYRVPPYRLVLQQAMDSHQPLEVALEELVRHGWSRHQVTLRSR